MAQAPKRIALTKEMTDEIQRKVRAMEGKEIREGAVIDLSPEDLAWYIAYKTTAAK